MHVKDMRHYGTKCRCNAVVELTCTHMYFCIWLEQISVNQQGDFCLTCDIKQQQHASRAWHAQCCATALHAVTQSMQCCPGFLVLAVCITWALCTPCSRVLQRLPMIGTMFLMHACNGCLKRSDHVVTRVERAVCTASPQQTPSSCSSPLHHPLHPTLQPCWGVLFWHWRPGKAQRLCMYQKQPTVCMLALIMRVRGHWGPGTAQRLCMF